MDLSHTEVYRNLAGINLALEFACNIPCIDKSLAAILLYVTV